MFIGHFGLGFAAKAVAPRTSLGSLFLASEFLDLLWPVLMILGIEGVMILPSVNAVIPLVFTNFPFSHSLAFVVIWSFLFAVFIFVLRQDWRSSVVMGLLVASHWLLDALVHAPDLPLFPGSHIRVGLGLWSSYAGTLAVEFGIFFFGLWFYVRASRPDGRKGSYGLGLLVLFLVLIYMASIFGPPPPDVQAIEWTNVALWLFVIWGYWLDRHRPVSSGTVVQ
ncbi:MAG: hypothetical protein FIA94_10550 [Nitrospirae bacterium]|nr:hypothetical protein [Nitrospirota bacterium]